MIRVLVADDHTVVRRGVLQILSEAADMLAAGEASTGGEVLRLVQENHYDVLVLDMNMPEGSGLEVLYQLRTLRPSLRTLILSMYPERQYAVRALKAGAAGYLTKESASHELVTAVRKIAVGGRYITQTLAEELAAGLAGETSATSVERLSDREYQVMRLLAMGKTVSEIGAELSLSVKTISTYRGRILEKLNLRNTAEIIRFALQLGIV